MRLYFVISSILAKIKASVHFWIHIDIAVFYIAMHGSPVVDTVSNKVIF